MAEVRHLRMNLSPCKVESLTAARQAAAAGNEPADSIRAVNALLTQLDQLRSYPNVMVRSLAKRCCISLVASCPTCDSRLDSKE